MTKKNHNYNGKGLAIVFILCVMMILGVSLFSISYSKRVILTFENQGWPFKDITNAATQVSSYAKRAEGHLMLYLSFHRDIDRQKIPARLESLGEEIAILTRLVKEEKALAITKEIKSAADKIQFIINPLLVAHDKEFQSTGRFEILNQQEAVLAAHDIFSQLRELGVELAERELELESKIKTQIILTADKLRKIMFGLTLCIIAFILFLGIVLIRSNQNLNQEILYRKEAELELKHSYQTQSAVNTLLSESLGNATIMDLLDKCLKLILSLPWLSFESMGSIFLVEEEPDVLSMKVQHGFPEELKKKCASIPFGNCLCGSAALKAMPVFSNHIDARHSYQFKGMEEHGHYCIPIIAKQKVLGVLNIYVKQGHERKEFEINFLTAMANTLAGILTQRYGEEEKKKIEAQLNRSQKLDAIGQLAAGIAHEINTPIQYIGNNTSFLKTAFEDLDTAVKAYDRLLMAAKTRQIDKEMINEVTSAIEEADLMYLEEEVPAAIEQSLQGIRHVSKIVTSMKEFAHPSGKEKVLTDINHALDNALTVAKNEWKYVARLTTDFDASLPLVMCNPGELNQVFLNMIINASHSIADVLENKPDNKGSISIRTFVKGEWVIITISDNGRGIPLEIQNKIFDPFFTTKEIGRGTGQGLAISHSIIVENHKGRINFETQEGKGTTFIIELPV